MILKSDVQRDVQKGRLKVTSKSDVQKRRPKVTWSPKYGIGIGANIRTRQEIQCLPYAGFFTIGATSHTRREVVSCKRDL